MHNRDTFTAQGPESLTGAAATGAEFIASFGNGIFYQGQLGVQNVACVVLHAHAGQPRRFRKQRGEYGTFGRYVRQGHPKILP